MPQSALAQLALALNVLAAAAAAAAPLSPLQTGHGGQHAHTVLQRESNRPIHPAFAQHTTGVAHNLASRCLSSRFLGYKGNLCKSAPGSALCRRVALPSPTGILGLRAQVNPDSPPPPPAQEQEPIIEPGIIDWDAVNMQFKLFTKMALPYFKGLGERIRRMALPAHTNDMELMRSLPDGVMQRRRVRGCSFSSSSASPLPTHGSGMHAKRAL